MKFKFQVTWCSNCGREFGPGNHGFSHCEDHQQQDRHVWMFRFGQFIKIN
jgi:hypothetical protein